jgi:SRSO17 transposase
MEYQLNAHDIQDHANSLIDFHGKFTTFFNTSTRSVAVHALEYLKGQLLLEPRRNMNKMSKEVSSKNEQALSHFISNSPWDDTALIKSIGEDAVDLLGKRAAGLIVDESGIPKQGKESVGVARQYCGSLGKVDNCQVGVFIAYSVPGETTLIDRRLYLPEQWTEDAQRCNRAGVPENGQIFRTKAKYGLEMILNAKEEGIPFEFVGMDAHYGEQPWLLSRLEEEQIVYVADIPCDTRIYLEYPEVGVPERKGDRGKNPTKVQVLEGNPVKVKDLASCDDTVWYTLKVRDIERGELWIRFAAIRVWRIEDELPHPKKVWLLIRKEMDESDIKFSFSNFEESTPIEILAERQSRRYFVERALEDAKGLAGLDEYQVTGWRGWYHHTAMVLLAQQFRVKNYLEFRLMHCKVLGNTFSSSSVSTISHRLKLKNLI